MCQTPPKTPSVYLSVCTACPLSKEVLLVGYHSEGFTLKQELQSLEKALLGLSRKISPTEGQEATHPDELSCTLINHVTYSTLPVV